MSLKFEGRIKDIHKKLEVKNGQNNCPDSSFSSVP